MAVGEFVPTKFLWLLDMVEVVGIAMNIGDDDFDIDPDPNYRHLISYVRGNNPLPWLPSGSPGVLHCETYVPDPSSINRAESWPLPTKPGPKTNEPLQPFEVKLRDGSKRPLIAGDHVRVVGRWVMDHHPEYCDRTAFKPPLEPKEKFPLRCRDRGWLRVGISHVEFHPFLWDDIRLVEPPRPSDVVSVILSLAAPLHEEQYLSGNKWFMNGVAGVSGKVFYTEDLSNYHETVATCIRVPAPELPLDWADIWRELRYEEHITEIDQWLLPDEVRSIIVKSDMIEVQASVTATNARHGELASILDPARGKSIFQARYNVWWKLIGARISCVDKPVRNDPEQHIHAVGGVLPDGMPWKLLLAEAVALVKRGHRFYVEQPAGDRVEVVIGLSRYGNEYLKTVADNDEPNNLLALPKCPSEKTG